MINSKAIWPVVKLAEEREQTALLALNQAAGQLREEQQRFDQLRGYLDDYLSSTPGDYPLPGAAFMLQNRQGFVDRLKVAIGQQERRLLIVRNDHAALEAGWRELRLRRLGLQQLAEEADRQARLRANKKEQHRLDEMATQRVIANRVQR
ncbi:MAG: flagellar export protein FliJ [Pseudomonadales bacterium]|jgi:flagellar export protein FliJ|nr:flagellar export protein FliJ [Pseudomonadales bacterium]MCC6529961.1 flagellar export protein FliJ [Pseudomonadales bacterium]MCP5334052.1 flagellar export protein FliJ [Pseudomonadales bacterium]HMU89414.1 flagellar export protein FliJ [Pseudomonadales bacterium]HMW82477.1 flagellar export protein FliJ [Pseudomonadales bacterium]